MTIPRDFSTEEWELILSAPMAAGILVGRLSDPESWAYELDAVMAATHDLERTTQSTLLRAMSETLLTRQSEPLKLPIDLPADPALARSLLIVTCKQAANLVAKRAPEDDQFFRAWLLDVATRAASSTKEGGFLGFGGTLVSGEEQSAIYELAAALDQV